MRRRQDDWFEVLFGFRERHLEYDEVKENFELVKKTKLRSKVNGKSYSIGTFECLSLTQLRENCVDLPQEGTSTLRHIASNDVFLDHCDPENQHALFQAASQFNCLEFISPRCIPEMGVTGYKNDPTQGPACAIAAGPGTVYRNYFAPTNGQIGQTKSCQINNLDDVEILIDNDSFEYFEVYNGYTFSSNAQLEQLNEELENDGVMEKILGSMKIGVQWDVQVPFSERYIPRESKEDIQIVSQTFCSAISVGYSDGKSSLWAPIAKLVLVAAYEATLWAGVLNYHKTGCNKVFLTSLGGGVFRNKPEWIAQAIAMSMEAVKAHGLDVYLVHYRRVDSNFVRQVSRATKELISSE